MHLAIGLTIGASLVFHTLAASVPTRHVLHERSAPSSNSPWRRASQVDRDAIIPIRIALSQSNLDLGDGHLMDISDPTSANYGKHWTPAEVHAFFAPADEALLAVKQWLFDHGIDQSDVLDYENKGWLAVHVPSHKAEQLFKTSFFEHHHRTSGEVRIGCTEYHVPEHLSQHIDYITPGVKLSPPLTKRAVSLKREGNDATPTWGPSWPHPTGPWKMPPHWGPPGPPWQPQPGHPGIPAELQACPVNITLPCIRALYDIPIAHLSDDVNALGVFEDGNYWDQQDLNLFFAKYAPNIPQGTVPQVDSIDGGIPFHKKCAENGNGCSESMIDIDLAYGLIWPQKVIVYQVDDKHWANQGLSGKILGYLNNFLDALDGSYCNYTAYGITGNSPGIDGTYPDPAPGGYKGQVMCGVYQPARVISTSYGEAEADVPINYQKRQCNEFMKLGLQGHTFFFSSGDYGVATFAGDPGASPNGCLSGNGQNGTIFTPNNPVTCPYVTAAGATQLNSNETIYEPESALQFPLPGAPRLASAGGFSNYFTAPTYQQAAISEYFQNYDPGYPYYIANADASNIGANGGRYNRAGRGYPDVSANGANLLVYTNGTLGMWYGTSLASPIWASVITLINEERTAVGKGPVGFINPVLYANPQVFNDITNGSNPGCHSAGFHAVPGWDPITGLGTPKYPKLLELFMSLP